MNILEYLLSKQVKELTRMLSSVRLKLIPWRKQMGKNTLQSYRAVPIRE